MSLLTILFLLSSAVLAGAMNAIAGGGTILTFPALIAVGVSAVEANATSTLALLLGIAGSAVGFRGHLGAVRKWVAQFWLVSVTGGFCGAFLLTRTPEATFEKLAPLLLLGATVLFIAQNAFRRLAAAEAVMPPHPALSLALQFFVAVYGGYFGAGIGVLMLAVFGLIGLAHIHEMNALKSILSALINLVAALYFVFQGLIQWPHALILTAGATAGYFAGARLSLRIPQRHVRRLIGAIGLGISAAMLWQQFWQPQ